MGFKDFAARLVNDGAEVPNRPLQVLIVDDEEPIRRFVERALRDARYEIHTAPDGPSALALVASGRPVDVLVTDLMMPGMTGDELARRMRQSEPSLKVLYLTGFSDKLFKEKVTLWDDEAFLDKPCSVKGLQEAVALLSYGTLQGVGTRD
jgi:CheY-like chemotaxis protein